VTAKRVRRRASPRPVPTLREIVKGLVRAIRSGELARFARDVEAGADPIEAMHGHVCGPGCWHKMKVPRP
jgi:hypothetical protein